jgi:2-methylisocitrate lyase-like PEP mutase family enzyme
MPELTDRFRALHEQDQPLLIPNPWDAGSAKLLESQGFQALATTSSGFAATLGRRVGSVTRDEAIAHSALIVGATSLPVSADLENGFADEPEGIAQTIRLAVDAGLAGCSIEDYTGRDDDPIYDAGLARERIAAAVESAAGEIVITARCDNLLHGRSDLDEVITRLQSFQEAGADVLYAPGLRSIDDIRALVAAVDRPVNVLALPGSPTVPELAEAGVSRVSVGGGFAWVAAGAVVEASRELLDEGTYGWWERGTVGGKAARAAFSD